LPAKPFEVKYEVEKINKKKSENEALDIDITTKRHSTPTPPKERNTQISYRKYTRKSSKKDAPRRNYCFRSSPM